MKKTINATVERNSDGYYAIIGKEKIAGCNFVGYGDSVAEAKEDFLIGIRESLEVAAEMGKTVDVKADDIKVVYRYDLPSFFNDFDWINVSAFAKFAGINESKMRAYKTGVASASERTMKKISDAVHTLAATLTSASLG